MNKYNDNHINVFNKTIYHDMASLIFVKIKYYSIKKLYYKIIQIIYILKFCMFNTIKHNQNNNIIK